MSRSLRLAMAVLCLPVSAWAGAWSTHVGYLAGAGVYIEAGRVEGVVEHDTLEVRRSDALVARVVVRTVTSHRAVCDTVWTSSAIAIGDSVTRATPASAPLVAATTAPAPTPSPSHAPASAPASRVPDRPSLLHGRLGGYWLSSRTPGAATLTQPSLDARVDARGLYSGHVDLTLDLRARRTTRSFAGAAAVSQQSSRLYRGTITLRGQSPQRMLTIGRQTSPTLASVSLFDGVLLQTGSARYRCGVFSGTQPDPVRYTFASDVVQSGVFLERHQAPRAVRMWSWTLGAITSQAHGRPNRDFVFSQSSWNVSGWSGAFTQEVDVNRGWRRQSSTSVLSPTSTYLSLHAPVQSMLAFDAGFDNRRTVRLYRDRLTPETQFDDSYRQGAWGGATLSWGRHVRMNGELRTGTGGVASRAWSGGAECHRLPWWALAVRTRASSLTSGALESRLFSGSVSMQPYPALHADVTVGRRQTQNRAWSLDDREDWQSVDLDATVLGSCFVTIGGEHDRGALGSTTQWQAGVAFRY